MTKSDDIDTTPLDERPAILALTITRTHDGTDETIHGVVLDGEQPIPDGAPWMPILELKIGGAPLPAHDSHFCSYDRPGRAAVVGSDTGYELLVEMDANTRLLLRSGRIRFSIRRALAVKGAPRFTGDTR